MSILYTEKHNSSTLKENKPQRSISITVPLKIFTEEKFNPL
jgi:hypothetical protein